MLTLLAVSSIAATVFLLILAVGSREGSVRSRLDALSGQPQGGGSAASSATLSERLVMPFTDGIVQQIKRVMPTTMLEQLQMSLLQAGEPMTVNQYLTFQVVTTAAFILLPVLVIFGAGLVSGMMGIGLVIVFAVVGFFLPRFWLKQRVGQRQHTIIRGLPDAFDLITTCVEAGLGLDAALARVAEKVEGPFAEELTRTLREISLGKMRRDALKEFAQRTNVPDLTTFVNAVIQAEQMGSSIGAVLRVQAEQLRVRRRQRAEEQAYKAPIKMIFPLVLCILPTLFIAILGPAVLSFMRDFPGK
jgi:tight adherence protein C